MRLPRARGARGRGMGAPRMPLMGPRHPRMIRTPELPPPPYRIPRGPMRMRPAPYAYGSRMSLPDLPPRPPLPPLPGFHPGDILPPPPPRPLGMRPPRSYGLPPAYHPPGPAVRPPYLGRGRGRGRGVGARGRGVGGRGRGVKRLAASSNGGPKKTSKKKNKKRTADDEPSDFYCDACDRSCKTAELLTEHIAAHEVCGRDGCQFTAQPKVVAKHVQMQHDTGLYLRIKQENPEDVARWIAERKSRFPTKQNVETRLAQRREMFQRGERISSQGRPFFSRNHKENWTHNNENKNYQVYNNRQPSQNNHEQPVLNNKVSKRPNEVVVGTVNNDMGDARRDRGKRTTNPMNNRGKWRDNDACRGNLPKFPGTAAFPHLQEKEESCKEEVHISDEEEENEKSNETKPLKGPVLPGVLAALMADYGSDMTEDDDDNENSSANKAVSKRIETTKMNNASDTVAARCELTITYYKQLALETKPLEQQISSNFAGNTPVPEGMQVSAASSAAQEHKFINSNNLSVIRPVERTVKHTSQTDTSKSEIFEHKNSLVQSPVVVQNPKDEDSDSGPEEQGINHQDTSEMPVPKPREDTLKPVIASQMQNREDPSKVTRTLPPNHRLPRHQLSLLEKLLGSEIRQERNMILQCVRYVVNNNFFDR